MGLAGLEPATKRLWVFCSNQLSYRPSIIQGLKEVKSDFLMVGDIGLEPMTPCLYVYILYTNHHKTLEVIPNKSYSDQYKTFL